MFGSVPPTFRSVPPVFGPAPPMFGPGSPATFGFGAPHFGPHTGMGLFGQGPYGSSYHTPDRSPLFEIPSARHFMANQNPYHSDPSESPMPRRQDAAVTDGHIDGRWAMPDPDTVDEPFRFPTNASEKRLLRRSRTVTDAHTRICPPAVNDIYRVGLHAFNTDPRDMGRTMFNWLDYKIRHHRHLAHVSVDTVHEACRKFQAKTGLVLSPDGRLHLAQLADTTKRFANVNQFRSPRWSFSL